MALCKACDPRRSIVRLRWMAIALSAAAALYTGLELLPVAVAQEAGQAAAGGEQDLQIGQVPTVIELFKTSPVINSILLALSVLALLLFAYLLLSLSSSSFNPPRFNDDVTKLIINRQFEQAVHLCQTNSQIFASSIIQRVIENREKDHGVLMDILAAEGRRRSEAIWNRINYLSEISNIAPMLGLLGTVVGMIKVFFTLTTRVAGEKAAQLAEGIAEAMGTTMFGLVVAIAAGAFYTICRTRATGVLAEVEQVCHTTADHTQRAASDPRLKRIDALAEAARQKVSRSVGGVDAGA